MEFVTYEQFGAVGDGVTEDFAAIKAAHDYANEHGLTVKADSTKTYYIHETYIDGKAESAIIQTDVEWNGAHFIIDDTDIGYYDGTERANKSIFRIVSDYEKEIITDTERLAPLAGIGEGTKKINLKLGYPALLCIYNDNQRVYRRTGEDKSAETGFAQLEIILVDSEGNVDESTPFMFNYNEITKVEIVRTDIKPITVSGGIFTTKASRVNAIVDGKKAGYFSRGLHIGRSYATLVGIEHYMEGEVTTFEMRDKSLFGPAYYGFFICNFAHKIILKDCILTARRYHGLMGTYEFNAERVNIIRLVNCKQSNFIVKDEDGNDVYSMIFSPVSRRRYYWGVGGTNYCKNMEYIGCRLSRFDAHMGLYNGKIIDCEINAMELIGKGEMLIENVKWYDSKGWCRFLDLRFDYGSTWDGTLKVKNTTLYVNSPELCLVGHHYTNWNYGYVCHFPNIDIENLKIESSLENTKVCLLTENESLGKEPHMHLPKTLLVKPRNSDDENDRTNLNPITAPEYVKIDIAGDIKVHMTKSPFFENTDFSGCKPGQIVIDE